VSRGDAETRRSESVRSSDSATLRFCVRKDRGSGFRFRLQSSVIHPLPTSDLCALCVLCGQWFVDRIRCRWSRVRGTEAAGSRIGLGDRRFSRERTQKNSWRVSWARDASDVWSCGLAMSWDSIAGPSDRGITVGSPYRKWRDRIHILRSRMKIATVVNCCNKDIYGSMFQRCDPPKATLALRLLLMRVPSSALAKSSPAIFPLIREKLSARPFLSRFDGRCPSGDHSRNRHLNKLGP